MITAFGLWMNLSKKNMQVIFTVALYLLSPSVNDLIKIQYLLQGTDHMARSAFPCMTACCQKKKENLQSFLVPFCKDDDSNRHCYLFAV